MAYLKGGSVVDGNLYVEGGLVVRNIATSAGGQLPTLEQNSAKADYIIKFINDQGALRYTQLGEWESADESFIFTDKDSFTFKVNGDSTESTEAINIKKNSSTVKFTLNTSSNYITVKDSIIYDENGNPIPDGIIDTIEVDTLGTSLPSSFKYSKEKE